MKIKLFNVMIVVLGLGLIACSGDKTNNENSGTETEVSNSEMDGNATVFKVNTTSSVINWSASKPGKDHMGVFPIQSGELEVKGDAIVGGNVVIDVANLQAKDPDGNRNDYLEGHLKGSKEGNRDDFFNVEKYPTATYKITKVTEYTAEGDEANYMIYGDLTMKGITKPVNFKASVNTTNGVLNAKTSEFTIDRTEWGINYDSGSVIKDLVAEKIIVDNVPISINLVANK